MPNVKILVLSHSFGDLGVTHTVHLWLDGKRVVHFLLAIIELFSLALTAAALLCEICRVLCHSLGDLGVTYTVLLWLVGKRVVDFFSAN